MNTMDKFGRNGYTNKAYSQEPNNDEIFIDDESEMRWLTEELSRSPIREPPIGSCGAGRYVELECAPMLPSSSQRRQQVLQRAASMAYRSEKSPVYPRSLDCSFDAMRHSISTHTINSKLNNSFICNTSTNHNTSLTSHHRVVSPKQSRSSHNASFSHNTSNMYSKINEERVNRNAVSQFDLNYINKGNDRLNQSTRWTEMPPVPPPRPPKPMMAIQPIHKPPICYSPGIDQMSRPLSPADKSFSKVSMISDKSRIVAPAPTAALCLSGLVMLFCGLFTCALTGYLLSKEGRRYYLDIAMVAGFVCFLLGGLAIRPRRFQWLPNRNFVSGYMMVSAFSLLTAAGLVVLCTLQNQIKAQVTHQVAAGAVAALGGLSLLIASLGVLASHCFKYPPPDNRVDYDEPTPI